MVDIARPRLAEGLAALTSTPVGLWLPWMKPFPPTSGAGVRWALTGERVTVHITLDGRDVSDGPTATWTVTDPADAQECLVARGLLPEGWCGDVRRGWAQHRSECPRCGVGCYPLDGSKGVCVCDVACDLCNDPAREVGASPCTIPDFVAVTSLGWLAIQRAEELARAACAALREYGCPQPERVVWKVGERGFTGEVWRRDSSVPSAHTVRLGQSGYCTHMSKHGLRRIDATAVESLWAAGLALDAIDRDAVRIVVPPVGGAQ